MPYKIVKVTGGYKVKKADDTKMKNGRYFMSNKPLSKKQAEKQKKAVDINETKNQKIK